MRVVEGKTAFITGGGSGVGFGMAQVFSKAGMKVVIADIRQDHLDQAMAHFKGANDVHAIALDVTDREAFARAADEAERVFGKVHLVCNNAGINLFNDMGDATYDDWDWVLGVNLGGVVNGVQTFASRLKAHGGHIVNTASMAAFVSGQGAGIYTASKFAVRGLTDSLRLNLAKDGIGVSTLCPGLTRSRIMGTASPEPGAEPGALFNDMSGAMDPLELGEAVLRGIRRNDPYILPHGEFKDEVREIFDEILDLFPEGQDVPEGRLAFERRRREITEAAKRGEVG